MLNSIFLVENPVVFAFDIVLACALLVALILFCIYSKVSIKVIVTLSTITILLVLANALSLIYFKTVIYVVLAFLIVYVSLLLTKQEKENIFKVHKHVNKKDKSLTNNETDELFNNLAKAVKDLSASKTGALITLERNDIMDQYMQSSGVKVNAPVTPELLETIFFNKTPLHDGASIIRGNIILSSAVFYQPTQKPLNGKYGSRHRAAIGISEVCDALTIVVSEETGKVSFAFKGELIPVPVAQFIDKLKEYYY